jgi:hypothetical protein
MLAVAGQRFALVLDHRTHAPLLLLQALAASGVAIGLALLCPDMIQGDRWYKRAVLSLLILSSVVFVLIFTTHDLTAIDTSS